MNCRSREDNAIMYNDMAHELGALSDICVELLQDAANTYSADEGYNKMLSTGSVDRHLSVLQSTILRMRKKIKGDL